MARWRGMSGQAEVPRMDGLSWDSEQVVNGALAALVALSWVAAGLASGLVWRAVKEEPLRFAWATAALVLAALGLRLAAPWGPYDLNVRNAGSWGGAAVAPVQYGLGVNAMVASVGWWWPGPTPMRFVTDVAAVVSSASVGLLVVVARAFGTSRRAAWLAGALLAVHPAAVRYGHTDVQAVPETLWTLVALLGVASFAREGGWIAAVVTGLGTGLLAHARPEALGVPVVVAAFAVASVPSAWRDRRVWAAVGLAAIVAAPQASMHLSKLGDESAFQAGVPNPLDWSNHPLPSHGLRHLISFDPAWVPVWVSGLAFLAPAARAPSRALRWTVIGAMVLLSLLVAGDSSWTPADGTRPGFARHQLRALPFAAWAQALGASWLISRLGLRAMGWWLVPVALAATTLPSAFSRRIGQAEFRFVTSWLDEVDRSCVLYAPRHDMDAGFKVGAGLGRFDDRLLRFTPEPPEDGGCWLYYRSAECDLHLEGFPLPPCAAFEAEHRLEPVHETWLAAGTWIYDDHLVDPVRVGLYRVLDVPGSGQDGVEDEVGQGGVGVEGAQEGQGVVEGEDGGGGQVAP